MNKILIYAGFGLIALTLTIGLSCKPKAVNISGDALSVIPSGSSNVSAFNPRQLMEKADFTSIKSMEFYQDMLKKARQDEPAMAAILENPEESGIDLDKNAYFFTKMNQGDDMDMMGGLAFSLSDASKFADMLKSADVGGFEKADGFTFAMPESGTVIAWNENIAFVGGGNKKTIVSNVESIFKTTSDQSIANDPAFMKAMKGEHDITGYANFDAYAEMLPEMMMAQLGAMGITEDDLIGNNLSGFMDFKDGEIYSESYINLSKKIEKDVNMLFNDKISTDFSPYIPAEGLSSFMTFAMDLKGTNQLLKEKGVGGMANLAMARYGLTADDLAGALGGDIMVAAYTTPEKKSPDLLFGTNIEDQALLDKFVKAGKDGGLLFAEGENLYSLRGTSGALNDAFSGMGASPSITSNDAQLLIHDGKLFISSRKDVISKIEKGGYASGERIDAARYNNLSKNIFGMYLDFSDLGNFSDQLELLKFKDMEIKSNSKNSQMRLSTDNKNENSLKSIFKMMNEAYKKDKMNIKIDDKSKKLS